VRFTPESLCGMTRILHHPKMSYILQQRNAFIGKGRRKLQCSEAQHRTYHMQIEDVCNSNQQESQYLPADSKEAHFAGRLMIVHCAHNSGNIIWLSQIPPVRRASRHNLQGSTSATCRHQQTSPESLTKILS